jgi:hypothetical protein
MSSRDLGVAARSHALLADHGSADALFTDAIERLACTASRCRLARAHLLYGEWLRRQPRRMDARKELQIAHEMFTDFGMEAFAERGSSCKRGERARKRTCRASARHRAMPRAPASDSSWVPLRADS